MLRRILTGALAVLLVTGFAFGQDSLNVSVVGARKFVNYTSDVTVVGNTAYLSAWEQGLWTVDISDPANLAEMGCIYLPGQVTFCEVREQIAYTAAESAGLRFVDVSDPAAPAEIGYYDPEAMVYDFALDGDLAYLANGTDGFRILDISDMSQPEEVSVMPFGSPGGIRAVGKSGNYAYCSFAECECGYGGRFYVIDVSDPANPLVTADTGAGFMGTRMIISGNYAYIGTIFYGLKIMDISDPLNPFLVGGYSVFNGDYMDFCVSGDTVYCAFFGYGLVVLDVSDPGNPVSIAELSSTTGMSGIDVTGSTIFTSGSGDALMTIDQSLFPNLYMSGALDLSGDLRRLDFRDGIAYVGGVTGGIGTLDVSGFGNLNITGSCGFDEDAVDIIVDGDYCYVAGEDGTLGIFDISDPTTPLLANSVWIDDELHEMSLEGDLLYVNTDASYDYTVYVMDISMPENPYAISSINPWYDGYIREIYAIEGYLFLTQHNHGLRMYDMSDPAHPVLCWTVPCDEDFYGLDYRDDLIIVANGSDGINFIDVSDMMHPVIIGEYDPVSGTCWDVRMEGDYAFLRYQSSGLQIVDISDISNPFIAGSYDYGDSYLNDFEVEWPYAYTIWSDELLKLDYGAAVGVEELPGGDYPSGFSLSPIYPNPFNGQAVIPFTLDRDGRVEIDIFDITGRTVGVQYIEPLQQWYPAGMQSVVWDAEGCASGIYLVRLTVDGRSQGAETLLHSTRKVVLLK
ncbi:MAG: T9SS type A sorting domain-containing protein [FCB group bacterium]|nr:T9SS type A sorting domain-containing protein [FCB group bacterium]